jgi:hypothetical protein
VFTIFHDQQKTETNSEAEKIRNHAAGRKYNISERCIRDQQKEKRVYAVK